jgi:hypothetical protein
MESKRFAKKRDAAEEVPETDSVSISCIQAKDRANKENEEDISDDVEASGNIFSIDHSKRGTAKCLECKKCISKDDLRIGKSVPYKSIHIKRYYHVTCAFKLFQRARLAANVISDINQLDGADALSEEEKQLIEKHITAGNNGRSKPLPDRLAGRAALTPQSLVTTRKRPVQYSAKGMKILFTNADQFSHSKKAEVSNYINSEKPLIVAVSEVKPKHAKERDDLDYSIPGYSMHPVNIDSTSPGRGIVVYTHDSIEK